ncbi:alkaline phosphatase PafA [Gramella sp. AN32]|uniref:Alkaline phosphatase PafA n=1 Tax=Christiangramia antarctica TaxID=2058158 RepID=A0ABW5X725_9FLAO|nr:alkaline phosphatase PafA [Gramella sp. AN32]MCM4157482.1 alkaline phosphatase [Gramella sp. AN32]
MKKYIFTILFLLSVVNIKAQSNEERPKLVIGIVVDQMRYDYLTRFWDQYGEGGFKRIVNDGFNFKNNHFNYVPTYTGPGHASVFSGTTPAGHGIISNSWFDKFEGQYVYCASDDSVTPVGTKSNAGKMSPHRMLTTSFADENRLFTQLKGKTIGIALKDRGAILPAGHTANAAYWFHGSDEARWITSSFYMTELPQWVQDFNNSGKAKEYLKVWNPIKDIKSYSQSGIDENTFEGGFAGQDKAVFPYDLKNLAKGNGNYELIKATPFGNDLTAEFAKAAILGEQLGKDNITDVLTLSFSSTDYVGHNFGVNSKEIEDTYIRLDMALADFLSFLDENVGKGEYTLFLTADHGGVDVPGYLKSNKIPAGYYNEAVLRDSLYPFVEKNLGKDLIKNISNGQIFFDYDKMSESKVELVEAQNKIAHFLLQQDNIYKVFTREQMQNTEFTEGIASKIQNGFNQKRSGDVIYLLDPGYIVYSETGSTHGSGYSYDTHVPLLFFGKGIKKGSSTELSEIPDIAPTISALLGIEFPNGTTGHPLKALLD